MRPFVNTAALTALRMDSAALGPLTMIVHPVEKAGSLIGTVFLGKEVVGRFDLEVLEDSDRMQADVDLSRFGRTGSTSETRFTRHKVKAGGYLLLYVGEGAGGFRVTLERAEDRKAPDKPGDPVFDSAALAKGDMVAVTLLRPGAWEADGGRGGQARITVAYPKQGDTPFRPREQGHAVTVGGGKMSPKTLKTDPGEGIVFSITDDTCPQLRLSLVEPDNGPEKDIPRRGDGEGKVRRRVRWQNPRQQG
ncbi:hypothetical protein [Pseudooceanicola sp. LIPI14-2-Ac024]|uniref:hypothetical protein n=1 Tax=Pseudooceanicola sp. LIPI14-2-Ac024 TaxID=3344875 RepID=UPI0035D06F1E